MSYKGEIRALVIGLLCAGVASLSACNVGPRYHKPDIPVAAQWHEAPNSGPEAAAVWPAPDWWQGFGSAELNDLIAQAQRNNDDLAAAVARVEEADAQLKIAGAPLLPSVDFAATATRERPQIGGLGPRVYNVFNPVLSASYEIDFWGKNRNARDAARAAARGSRFDRQTVALAVVSSVATTYFQALELRDRLGVAQQNLANGEHILRGLQAQQRAGTATGLDVAQQETAVALLNAAIPPLQQQYRQSVYALAILVGKTPESVDVEHGSLADMLQPNVAVGLPSELLTRRPDVASAEQQLIEANADIGVARAALFPSIQLTASGGYASTALTHLISPANRAYAASAGLTQPIFQGGALRGQLSYSKARREELLASYHKTVVTALSNVESALVAAQQTLEQAHRQREAVRTAQRAYDFAQAQQNAGTVNILTVLNTENALFSAQDAQVQIDFARLQALINLFTALGGGWTQG